MSLNVSIYCIQIRNANDRLYKQVLFGINNDWAVKASKQYQFFCEQSTLHSSANKSRRSGHGNFLFCVPWAGWYYWTRSFAIFRLHLSLAKALKWFFILALFCPRFSVQNKLIKKEVISWSTLPWIIFWANMQSLLATVSTFCFENYPFRCFLLSMSNSRIDSYSRSTEKYIWQQNNSKLNNKDLGGYVNEPFISGWPIHSKKSWWSGTIESNIS